MTAKARLAQLLLSVMAQRNKWQKGQEGEVM